MLKERASGMYRNALSASNVKHRQGSWGTV